MGFPRRPAPAAPRLPHPLSELLRAIPWRLARYPSAAAPGSPRESSVFRAEGFPIPLPCPMRLGARLDFRLRSAPGPVRFPHCPPSRSSAKLQDTGELPSEVDLCRIISSYLTSLPLYRNFLFGFGNGKDCMPIAPAPTLLRRFSSGTPQRSAIRTCTARNYPRFQPTFAISLLPPTRCRQIRPLTWPPALYFAGTGSRPLSEVTRDPWKSTHKEESHSFHTRSRWTLRRLRERWCSQSWVRWQS